MPIPALDTVGLRIRYARRELRKLTQAQAAKLSGIAQPSFSEIETGETKEISGPVLISVAKALKVRPEWIVTGDGPIEAGDMAALPADERELLEKYREASASWKVAVRYMAGLRAFHEQDEVASSVNGLLAKISATPVPDSRLGKKWTRPDKKDG